MATVHPVPWMPSRRRPEAECSASGLVELMLKDRAGLDELMREESRQAELIPRFLAIALMGFTIYGIAATVVLNAAGTLLAVGAGGTVVRRDRGQPDPGL